MAQVKSLIFKDLEASADADYISEQRQLAAKAVTLPSLKSKQNRSYTSKRKGYVRALPIGPLTPLASESRWAVMAVGTERSKAKTCSRLDAKHKPVLGNRADMVNAMSKDGLEGEILQAKHALISHAKQAIWKLSGINIIRPLRERKINSRTRREYARAMANGEYEYAAQLKADFPGLV